jgi:AcrR family transcriptional regulator
MATPPDAPIRLPGHEEKRRRILRAALEVCTRGGVASARMEEIAAIAQVSKGTLYRFFESREDLLLAAAVESYQRALGGDDVGVPGAGDPRDRLTRLFDALVSALAQVGAHGRVHYQAWGIAAATPVFEERLLRFLKSFHSERHARFEALVRDGQVAGVFRADVSPAVVADALAALLSGFVYRANFDPRAASPEALRACLDQLVRATLEPAQRAPESGRL